MIRKVAFVTMMVLGTARCAPMEPTVEDKKSQPKASEARGRFSDDQFLCTPKSPTPLWLDATPTYVGDVKAMLDSKCVSCHKAGGTPPDLSTFALAKANAAASDDEIRAGRMPPGGTGLPQEHRDHFSAWVASGTPESAPSGDDGAADGSSPANEGRCKKRPSSAGGQTDGADDGGEDGSADQATDSGASDQTDGDGDGADGSDGTADQADGGATDQADAADAADAADQADGGADGGTPPVTYNANVKALLAAKCVSCHKVGGTAAPVLDSFAAAKAGGVRSGVRINAGTMPPAGPLSAMEKELFKAWAAGGYLEAAP